MLDGIYSITFRGRADWGIGMLILQRGVITGADAAGVLYDGSYLERGAYLQVKLTLTVPPGATLVQGTLPQPTQYSISSETTLLTKALLEGEPTLVQLPPGPVNVIFRRLRALDV
jgi:hypothetical protein